FSPKALVPGGHSVGFGTAQPLWFSARIPQCNQQGLFTGPCNVNASSFSVLVISIIRFSPLPVVMFCDVLPIIFDNPLPLIIAITCPLVKRAFSPSSERSERGALALPPIRFKLRRPDAAALDTEPPSSCNQTRFFRLS